MLPMYAQTKENYGEANLICPLTRQIFQDPVLADDGHVYERTAIIQWISEHGTSPLTREPLSVDSLRSEENIKWLCECRQMPVTYSAENERIALPPLRVPRIPSVIGQPPIIATAQRSTGNRKRINYKICICTTAIAVIIVLLISIAFIVIPGSSGTICFVNLFQACTEPERSGSVLNAAIFS